MNGRTLALSSVIAVWIAGCGSEFTSTTGSGGGGPGGGQGSGAAGPGSGASGPGSTGPGGAGGDSATATVTASSGMTGECPGDGMPVEGDACDVPERQICTYDQPCCTVDYQCSEGTWKLLPSQCPAPACPPQPPEAGSACECMPSGCGYPCTGPAGSYTEAGCHNGAWEISKLACSNVFVCGEGQVLACGPDYICVAHLAPPAEPIYDCYPDPCIAEPLSCACAAVACIDGRTCLEPAGGSMLTCTAETDQ